MPEKKPLSFVELQYLTRLSKRLNVPYNYVNQQVFTKEINQIDFAKLKQKKDEKQSVMADTLLLRLANEANGDI